MKKFAKSFTCFTLLYAIFFLFSSHQSTAKGSNTNERKNLQEIFWSYSIRELRVKKIWDYPRFLSKTWPRLYLNHDEPRVIGKEENKWNMMEKVTEIRIDDILRTYKNKWLMVILCPTTHLMKKIYNFNTKKWRIDYIWDNNLYQFHIYYHVIQNECVCMCNKK